MSVYIPAELKRRIREHFGNCCAYCHTAEHLTVAIFEIEHIVPRSADAESVFENLCLACPTCNRYKATLTSALDPETEREASLFDPQRERWRDHFSWNEDATQVVGLPASGRATIQLLKMNRPQLIRVRRMWVALGEHPPT